jgi:hypothetical protein
MLYSIIETAKANGLIPFDYIAHCLEQLSVHILSNFDHPMALTLIAYSH